MFTPPASVHPEASFWLDVFDKAIKALAVLIGGAWAIFNINISRTYRKKVEVSVTGTLHRKENNLLLIVNCQIKNVGQVNYAIKQEGTCVEFFGIGDDGREEDLGLLEVFTQHHWVEPGESINEPKHRLISGRYLAIKTSLRVICNGIEWNSSCISTEDSIGKKAKLERDNL